MMVIYLPVKLNSIAQTVFELSLETEMLTDRQMDKKQTNKQTELHQF